MGGLKRKQDKQGCVRGENTTKRQKKRRRMDCDLPKQVDPSYSHVGSTSAGLVAQSERKKKRRLKSCRSDRHSNGLLSGEVSSEKEKQSLLAWVEMGMKSGHGRDVTMDSEDCFTNGHVVKGSAGRDSLGHSHTHTNIDPKEKEMCMKSGPDRDVTMDSQGSFTYGQVVKGSVGRDSIGHSHTYSNGDPKGKEMCISAPIRHAVKADYEWSKAFSSKGPSFFHAHTSERPYTGTNGCVTHKNKRKREVDKVLDYVVKRCIVVKSPSVAVKFKRRTTKTVVIAWGRNIPVTLTSEACAVEEWISCQNGDLFGLDVEWRPNRVKGQRNKVALLQLSNENECLIIQMLFLDRQPQALHKLLSDPSKALAGVGVLADGKRLLHDYGLECQGGIELTTLAVERLNRDELRNVGLKVLVQEVLGLALEKPKRVTLSNWAKEKLDQTQINYACMDAWASFALSKRLLVQT